MDPTREFPSVSALPERPELPDPFTTLDGERIETAEAWRETRRPELRALFEHYVYGRTPGPVPVEVERTEGTDALGGRATLTELTVRFPDLPADAPAIEIALFMPADRGAAPVFLGLNRRGNHATIGDDAVTVTESGERFGADERGERAYFWCVEQVIERGYAFATFHQADVDPDRDDFTDGVHPHFSDLPGPTGTEWGTLAAWAWGIRRAVDALCEEPAVREDAVAAIGHSRRGKATLLAGALDERIALVVPHQSGTGGCALSRENSQETVARINEDFPHWFNDTFPAFAGREERLPVDQHLLMALVAPRALLDTEGSRDYWANPTRAFDALQAAEPVYDLFGAPGAVGDGLLHGDDEITDESAGNLLQYRREEKHTLNEGYWEAILDFADLQFR